MTNTMIVITGGHFTGEVIVKDGIVINSAPIIRYMRGWTASKVRDYCNRKEWKMVVTELPEGVTGIAGEPEETA